MSRYGKPVQMCYRAFGHSKHDTESIYPIGNATAYADTAVKNSLESAIITTVLFKPLLRGTKTLTMMPFCSRITVYTYTSERYKTYKPLTVPAAICSILKFSRCRLIRLQLARLLHTDYIQRYSLRLNDTTPITDRDMQHAETYIPLLDADSVSRLSLN